MSTIENGLFTAFPSHDEQTDGLTKRELFAAMAMQPLVTTYAPESVAQMAVRQADALLAELERSA